MLESELKAPDQQLIYIQFLNQICCYINSLLFRLTKEEQEIVESEKPMSLPVLNFLLIIQSFVKQSSFLVHSTHKLSTSCIMGRFLTTPTDEATE